MITVAPPTIDVATVAAWLRLFLAPGQVTELRALDYWGRDYGYGRPRIVAGWFDDVERMAEVALELSQSARGACTSPPIRSSAT